MSTKTTVKRVSGPPKPRRSRARKQQRVIWLAQEIFAGMTVRGAITDVRIRAEHSISSAKIFWELIDKEHGA